MYLEIDEGFPKHRKTLRLRSIMKDPRAGWYMVDLWTWACRSCPDGDLSGISSYEIEEAANYQQCDGKLCKAMIDSGFIDTDGDGNPTGLHNWMKRTGAAIARMAKRASDMKALRDQRKRERDGTVTAQLQHGEPTNPTRPDQTSQDKTSPGDPPARDPGTTDTERKKTAYDWRSFFASRWWQKHGRQYGQGEADARACGRLDALLESLPEDEREKDWDRRENMVSEFLNRTDRPTVESGWSFSFFASGFQGLRIPESERPAKTSPFEKPQAPQGNYGKPVTMADVEAAKTRSAR